MCGSPSDFTVLSRAFQNVSVEIPSGTCLQIIDSLAPYGGSSTCTLPLVMNNTFTITSISMPGDIPKCLLSLMYKLHCLTMQVLMPSIAIHPVLPSMGWIKFV